MGLGLGDGAQRSPFMRESPCGRHADEARLTGLADALFVSGPSLSTRQGRVN